MSELGSMHRLARSLVRLYPRVWRERYEDELLALLETSPITVGALVDLVAGAVRERVRSAAGAAPQPVSLARELWRDLLRDLVTSVVVAIGAWIIATQVWSPRWLDPVDMTALVYLTVGTRVGVVWCRRYFVDYRAAMAGVPARSADLVRPGLRRGEYWCWMAIVSLTASLFLLEGRESLRTWFPLQTYMLVTLLNGATRKRLESADAQNAIRLAQRARSAT